MAGIGFELRKIYDQGGVFKRERAWTYAAFIYVGPLLMGMGLLVALIVISHLAGLRMADRDGILAIVSYAILLSLFLSSSCSLLVTRRLSDFLYEEKLDRVLPSYFGSSLFLLGLSLPVLALFLLWAGLSERESLLFGLLVQILTLTWNALSFLSAIRAYKGISSSYIWAFLGQILMASLIFLRQDRVFLLLAVLVAYLLLLINLTRLLLRQFPPSQGYDFTFLTGFDSYPALGRIGLFLNLGLYSHIFLVWFSPISRSTLGHLRFAPSYDVAMMLAFLISLIATVQFVISLEVRFYPLFRKMLALFDQGGTYEQIHQSEQEILLTLSEEMKYLAWKQVVGSLLYLFCGPILFYALPLGFTPQLQGYFQVLCLAYAIYAIANSFCLLLLFLGNYKDAQKASGLFALSSSLLSLLFLGMDRTLYGFGFLIGAITFLLFVIHYVNRHLSQLSYEILGKQSLFQTKKKGTWTRLSYYLGGLNEE